MCAICVQPRWGPPVAAGGHALGAGTQDESAALHDVDVVFVDVFNHLP